MSEKKIVTKVYTQFLKTLQLRKKQTDPFKNGKDRKQLKWESQNSLQGQLNSTNNLNSHLQRLPPITQTFSEILVHKHFSEVPWTVRIVEIGGKLMFYLFDSWHLQIQERRYK